jgi:hypothetical protein
VLHWPDGRIIGTAFLANSPQGNINKPGGGDGANLKKLNPQGVITWDIKGEQYPQPTSYVCAPDEIAKVAPEMENVEHSKEALEEFTTERLQSYYLSDPNVAVAPIHALNESRSSLQAPHAGACIRDHRDRGRA